MYYNTNLSVKETSRAVLSDFKGVDYSNPISRIQSNRASYMRNFINENGVNRKRNGWVNILPHSYSGSYGEIKGIYQFNIDKKEFIIAAYQNRYRLINKVVNPYSGTIYSWGKSLDKLGSVDKAYFFVNNNKLFIVQGIKYYVFCSLDGGETYGLHEISNNYNIVYIPTTTVNINKDDTENDIRASLEPVNMLTSRRKNKLVGDIAGSTFSLDAKNLQIITLPINKRVIITGEIKNDDGSIKQVHFTSGSSVPTNIVDNDNDDEVVGTINYETGKITFNIATTPPTPNQDNLIVEFEANETNDYKKIEECRIGSMFGVNGSPDRLFLSGNPKYPNIEWHSAENDFTYFPDINVTVVGSESSPIMGYSQLSDTTQIIYKKANTQEASIYFRTGKYQTIYESDGQTIKEIQAIFPIQAGAIGEGSISTRGNGKLANDTLMLSSNGIFGIEFSDNVISQQRFAKERSRFINAELTKLDLSSAEAITYKNRFYLSVGDKVYIADARYKSTVDGDMTDTFNYDWWIWDNCPVSVWAIIDDELWFGTKDFGICKFDENSFADTKIINLEETSILDSNSFTTNSVGMIKHIMPGDSIRFINNKSIAVMLLKTSDIIGVVNAEIYKNGIKEIHKAFRIKNDVLSRFLKGYFDAEYSSDTDWFSASYYVEATENSLGGLIQQGDKYFIYCEKSQSVIFVKNTSGDFIEVTENDIVDFYFKLENTNKSEFIIDSVDYESATFTIKYLHNNEPCQLVVIPPNYSSLVEVTHKIPVVAEWQTPAFNFGVIDTNKTMTGISISTEKYIGSRLKVGWKTKNTSNELNVKGISYFDFNNVDFKEFTFDNSFISSDTKRVKVNFNYIVFRFVSDNDKCCAINEFAVLYKVNNKNKGVR